MKLPSMLRRKVQTLCLVFLLLVAAADAFEQTVAEVPFSDDYVLRSWDVAEGLQDNHISSITCDEDGYLWLTDFGGLFKFDGARFVHMDDELVHGLPTSRANPALVTRDGSLWIGMERGGIGRIQNRQAHTVIPSKPLLTPDEWWPAALAEGTDGAIWVGSYSVARVTRLHEGTVATFDSTDGIPTGKETKVCITTSGAVWVATTDGCALFDGRRFSSIDPEAGGARRPVLAPSRAGGIWTSRGGKLLKYDEKGNQVEALSPAWFQDISQINALLEDVSGTLWIGTLDSGLFCYKNGQFERVHTSFHDIYCLMEDGKGNLWCGTWGGGLNRLSPRRFFLRQIQRNAPGEIVRSICEDAERRFWAVGRYGRVIRSEGSGCDSFLPVALPPGEWKATAVGTASGSGGVWLGTNRGLLRWENGQWSQTPLHEPVVSLFTGEDRAIWVGTELGPLLRYSEGKTESIDTVRAARAMTLDRNGRLWVGTDQGELFTRRDGIFEPVPGLNAQPNQTVRFILADGDDTLWIGVLQSGLYRCQKGRIQKVPAAPKGALRELRCLLIERQHPAETGKAGQPSPTDVFWIGTATGLLRTNREAIEGALDSGSRQLELLPIGVNEGLPNTELSMGFQNGAIQSDDGRLLFGTTLGLLEIPTNSTPLHSPSGGVTIEEAVSRNLSLYATANGPWIFPPNPDLIRIRYTLPELSTPEQVRFRYRLNGGTKDGRWTDVGRQREITLVQPAPGNFRVEVTAAVGDGPWIGAPAVVEFTVRATWWQTAAFRWGAVLAGIGLIGLLARAIEIQRMRTRIRRLEQEHAIERERARIARDMHDEVGANLTHIATTTRLATLDSPSAMEGHLRDIEGSARHTVESLDEIVWAVNPRNDTVAKTVEYICKFATNFLSKSGILPEVSIADMLPDRRISAEARHHLFLAVKETINNIVKHSAARNATVQVRITKNRLQLVVTDDGRGFDAENADSFSNGLINMRERMNALGGCCMVESRPAVPGCRVTFELPLSVHP